MHNKKGSTAKALIVGKDPYAKQEIQVRLEQSGHDIAAVCSYGPDAIKQLSKVSPNLVIVDVASSGEAESIEIAQRIRGESTIPILFVTEDLSDEFLVQARDTEPFGRVVKPLYNRELKEGISDMLSKSVGGNNAAEDQDGIDASNIDSSSN